MALRQRVSKLYARKGRPTGATPGQCHPLFTKNRPINVSGKQHYSMPPSVGIMIGRKLRNRRARAITITVPNGEPSVIRRDPHRGQTANRRSCHY